MSEKKHKLSKKHGLYAVAGAALIGTMTAAAITSPGRLHNVFNPDKYSFNDTRNNGNVAYNTASNTGGNENSDNNVNHEETAKSPNESKEKDDKSLSDSHEQVQNEKKDKSEQHKAPENADRDSRYNNNGSSQRESVSAGVDTGGFALTNTGLSTNVASSKDSTGKDLGTDSDLVVDMDKTKSDTIDSVQTVATAAPSKAPSNMSTPQATSAPSKTSAPSRTNAPAPVRTPAAQPTRRPSGGGSGDTRPETSRRPSDPSTPSNPPTNPTSVPQEPTQPPATEAPAPTEAPTPKPTKEPLPTAEPGPSKPSDIVDNLENNGSEVEVGKGEITITDRHPGGGGSVSTGGATRLDLTRFTGDQSDVPYIQISSTIRTINFETTKLLFPNLKGFIVDEKNKYYKSIDGVLYSKDGSILYACPAQIDEITEFPENLEKIYDGAFIGSNIQDLNLPNTVKSVGKNSFAQASIGTLVFDSDELTIGDTAFFNEQDAGLSVKKLVFKSTAPPKVTDNNALKFKNPNTGLDKSGMVIEVPDSENDSVLCEYMKAWGETIDGIYGSGMTSYLFNTKDDAAKRYSFEKNALYRKTEVKTEDEETEIKYDGFELLYAAPSTSGEFTPLYNTKVFASGAFDGCEKITSINIPSTVEKLEDGCFKGLKGLTSIVVSSTSPAQIGSEVWKDIDPDEVSIYVYPDSRDGYMESWGKVLDELYGEGTADKVIKGAAQKYEYIEGALYSVVDDGYILVDAPHTNLDNFTVDPRTVKIEAGAFGSKYTYNYVLIPESVKEIDVNAFGTTSIEYLVITSKEPPTLPENFSAGGVKKVYVPSGSLDAYKEAWGTVFKEIAGPSMGYVSDSHAVYGINEDKTYKLYNLPVVFSGTFTMLDTVKEIDERALYNCSEVEEIHFSVITEKIGKEAFANNTKLKNIDMSRLTALKELPEKAFYNCSAVTDMKLPELIEVIGKNMAENCSSVESINFDKLTNIIEIGDEAFKGCTSLKNVSFTATSGRKLTKVGVGAFEDCTAVESIRMPLNLENMSDKMFKGASSLNSISFSSNLKSIGKEALSGTDLKILNLASIKKLETVDERAFADNPELETLTLPENVVKVSSGIAENDTKLSNVVLSKNTEEIGDAAFRNCEALTEIEISKTITKIGREAFEGCKSLVKVVIKAVNPAEAETDAFGKDPDRNKLRIYVPEESRDTYIQAWDEMLYNHADEIIAAIENGGGTEDPDEPTNPTMPPTPTRPPRPTARPVESEVPIASDKPSETTAPSASEKPSQTTVPSASDKPTETAVPSASEKPSETAAPTSSDAPSETTAPSASDKPTETTVPSEGDSSSENDSASESGGSSKEPAVSDQDTKTEASAESEKSDNDKSNSAENEKKENVPSVSDDAVEPKEKTSSDVLSDADTSGSDI